MPETGSKMALKKWKFLFGIFRPEKQDYLFRCSVAPEKIFDQKSHVPFTFQPDFPESFCKW